MISLNSINLSATFGSDVNVNVNKYVGGAGMEGNISVNASRSNGPRNESINLQYSQNGLRTTTLEDTSAPFDADFLNEVDALVSKVASLSVSE